MATRSQKVDDAIRKLVGVTSRSAAKKSLRRKPSAKQIAKLIQPKPIAIRLDALADPLPHPDTPAGKWAIALRGLEKRFGQFVGFGTLAHAVVGSFQMPSESVSTVELTILCPTPVPAKAFWAEGLGRHGVRALQEAFGCNVQLLWEYPE